MFCRLRAISLLSNRQPIRLKASGVCAKAVSYTHLDVYKRQAFALYKLDDKGNKTRISMIDPASGSATKKTDVFYTDADGLMKTPEKLPLGRYFIEELQGPEGYYNCLLYTSRCV